MDVSPRVSVAELWLYPVKSLAGIPLRTAALSHAGIDGDRQWMIVDAAGKFVTQRKLPRLATIRTHLQAGGELGLTDDRGRSIIVEPPNGESQRVFVWRDACLAKAADASTNRWLTEAVASKAPLTLVYFDRAHPRPTDSQRFGAGSTYFADAAPFLVTNQASLHALNGHLQSLSQTPVDMRRFRPNIVITGLAAFAEHDIKRLTGVTSAVQLRLVDHCQRCSIITVDQSTGIASEDTSPFKQLAQLNSMPYKPRAPAFGVNSILEFGDGVMLRVGEALSVN